MIHPTNVYQPDSDLRKHFQTDRNDYKRLTPDIK
jgi:hypothetical protein